MFYTELKEWELSSFYPYVPLLGTNVETGCELGSITPVIKAEVPGGVYQDLLRTGLIEDPFYEMNSLKCEWVANKWWMYTTEVTVPDNKGSGRIHLCFDGIDYRGRIYLNGTLLGIHEGMNIPVEYDVTDALQYGQANIIRVLIENAPEEMGQIGYTSQNKIIKARYNYKWDFATRLVNLGLYKKVYLKETGICRFCSMQICAVPGSGQTAQLDVTAEVESTQDVEAEILYALSGYETGIEEIVACSLIKGMNKVSFSKKLSGIRQWDVVGRGQQALYQLTTTLLNDGKPSDTDSRRIGFKTLQITSNPKSPENALHYTFVVNGQKIYIKGVNLTPMNLLCHHVTRDRYQELLSLLADAHINLIRVWGGGYIESEDFYELCDEYGILVWQEFPQSSSGIDNTPSKDAHFLSQLKTAAICAVKQKRNHVSLAAWSGGERAYR